MVTTIHDDLPTHDIHGTDLGRVRNMLDRGYSVELIAECLGVEKWQAKYAVAVATDDREGSPEPHEIEACVAEIQAGWTEEQAILARKLEHRTSSSVAIDLRRRERTAASNEQRRRSALAAHGEKRRQRLDEGRFQIRHHPEFTRSNKRWEIRINHRDRAFCRRHFETREQCEQFGRQWLAARIRADEEQTK